MELGVHLPLVEFADEGQSLARLARAVDAARECGFAAVSANDHFLFQTPWLDGPTDVLSDGRVIAGVGPGSSERDYEAVGVRFVERRERFDKAAATLRALMRGDALAPAPRRAGGIPLWIGSWGSKAGLARVVRLGDGWLASAYNTTPEAFGAAKESLPDRFPSALATMWTWITEDEREADRVLRERLAPLLKLDADDLRGRLCIGPAARCAELLSRYAEAGCDRVYLWSLGDEPRQIELAARIVG